jgi:hypothetical protein
MSTRQLIPLKPTMPSFAPARGGLQQRRCACGGTLGPTGECEACKKKRLGLQTKLKVNKPGDIYEQEADRIADQVMAAFSSPAVSGAPPRVQRFSGYSNGQMDGAPTSVNEALASPGRLLEPTLRQDMEHRFGYDFSGVRVHTDAAAELSAQDIDANAYTVGHDMVFGAGQYAPGTTTGKSLIAHELAHVVQQGHSTLMPVTLRRSPRRRIRARDTATIIDPKTARLVMESIMTIIAKIEAAPTHPSRWRTGDPSISKYRELLSLWFELKHGKKADGSKLEGEAYASAFERADAETTPIFHASLQGATREAQEWRQLVERRWYDNYFEIEKRAASERRIIELEKTTTVFYREPQRVSREEFLRVSTAQKSQAVVLQRGAGIKVGAAKAGIIYYASKNEPRLMLWGSPAGVFFLLNNEIYKQDAGGFSDDIISGAVIKAAQDVEPFVDLITFRGPAYAAAFAVGVGHGFLTSVWDAVSGIAKLIYDVLKSIFSLDLVSDLGELVGSLKNLSLDRIKEMLGDWATEWAEKLHSKSVWTAGHAHGYLTGYVMAEAAMLLLTGGAAEEAKAALWASDLGKLAKGSRAFKTLETAVDKVSKVRRAAGGEFDKAVDALRKSRLGKVVKTVEVTGAAFAWTADKVAATLNLPSRVFTGVAEKIVANVERLKPFFDRIKALGEGAKRWLFGCHSPCEWEAEAVEETMKRLAKNDDIEKAAELAARTSRPSVTKPHEEPTELPKPAVPVRAPPKPEEVTSFLKKTGAEAQNVQTVNAASFTKVKLKPGQDARYVLRDSDGVVLKVGKTSESAVKNRFSVYKRAGKLTDKQLHLDVFPLKPSAHNAEHFEKALRAEMEGLGHRMPWDNTDGRLGRSGFGTPGEGVRSSPVTKGEMAELLTVYEGSLRQVGVELGVHAQTVRLWAKSLGLTPKAFKAR